MKTALPKQCFVRAAVVLLLLCWALAAQAGKGLINPADKTVDLCLYLRTVEPVASLAF